MTEPVLIRKGSSIEYTMTIFQRFLGNHVMVVGRNTSIIHAPRLLMKKYREKLCSLYIACLDIKKGFAHKPPHKRMSYAL